MTDAAIATDTRAIVQRRLIGLFVLLLIAFLLSLLLRVRPDAENALPSVVIPLTRGVVMANPVVASSVPTLDAAESPDGQSSAGSAADPASRLAPATGASTKPPAKSAKDKPADSSKPQPAIAAKPAAPAPATTRWFVAIDAYKDPMAAAAIVSRIKLAGLDAVSVAIRSNGERLHRVRAGPYASKAAAESARATLIVEGLTKATVITEK